MEVGVPSDLQRDINNILPRVNLYKKCADAHIVGPHAQSFATTHKYLLPCDSNLSSLLLPFWCRPVRHTLALRYAQLMRWLMRLTSN